VPKGHREFLFLSHIAQKSLLAKTRCPLQSTIENELMSALEEKFSEYNIEEYIGRVKRLDIYAF